MAKYRLFISWAHDVKPANLLLEFLSLLAQQRHSLLELVHVSRQFISQQLTQDRRITRQYVIYTPALCSTLLAATAHATVMEPLLNSLLFIVSSHRHKVPLIRSRRTGKGKGFPILDTERWARS